MKSAFLLVPLLLATAPRARAFDELAPPAPCMTSARLNFDEAPSYRLADPNQAEKQRIGMNPLQNKTVEIEATNLTVVVRVRTHRSFETYWDFAKKRAAAGVPVRGTPDNARLRGGLTHFTVTPKGRPDDMIDIRAWLEFDSPSIYRPQVHVATANELAATMPVTGDDFTRAPPPADIASPIDITLGLNEAELRMPTHRFGFKPDDVLVFRFRKGEAAVCVPGRG